MHRCFAETDRWEADRITLAAEEEHHLLDVLRAREGDEVTVTDGKGREVRARLELQVADESQGRACLSILPNSEVVDDFSCRVTLIQSLLKGERMDLVVEKATELGVTEIYPVMTERVVTRIPEARRLSRRQRWERIATSAMKQCGVRRLPEIRDIVRLPKALEELQDFDVFILGSLSETARPLRSILEILPKQGRIAVLIGPEGDLTDEEIELARNCGAIEAGFGKRVLRAETAAIYALGAINLMLDR
jgi:16S rRNA (uracil1498-N3)-methyltransferase